jgi:hypothetical protein
MTAWRRRSLVIAAGVALVFVALAAVALLSGGGGAGPEPTARTAAPSGSDAADAVSPIRLRSLDGMRIALPAGKPGALFFSVSSCLSCVPSARALNELTQQLGPRVDALFISMDPADPPAALAARRDAIGDPSYPFAIDSSGTLASRYRITALGTVLIYDAQGRIVERLIDPKRDQLEAAFREAGAA